MNRFFSDPRAKVGELPAILVFSVFVIPFSTQFAAAAEQGVTEIVRFDHALQLEETSETSANVSMGDINDDGHLDIVLVKGRHWPLLDQLLFGDGTGNFQAAKPLAAIPDKSYSGELADIDADGDLDMVVSNDSPDPNLVYINNGDGEFIVGSTFGDPEWPTRHIDVADINGDGLPDIIVANRTGRRNGFNHVCYNQGQGVFTDSCTSFARGSTTTITTADFNRDGRIDLIVPHRDGGQSYIYLNGLNNTFDERIPFGPSDSAIRKAVAADINNDGNLDIVAIDEQKGSSIILGERDGTYGASMPLGKTTVTPYALTIADLNEDGRTDVIIGYIEAKPVAYFNLGNGNFSAIEFGDDQGDAYGFAVGDTNEDGIIDIAMARSGAQNVLYFGSIISN